MEAIARIKNTDYLAAKKIYKNRKNIFIELMDKVIIHVEKMEKRDKRVENVVVTTPRQ
jgi:CRISPR-associated protein Cas8b1/Cst1 subtype I-B